MPIAWPRDCAGVTYVNKPYYCQSHLPNTRTGVPLQSFGIAQTYHYAPLHYLPFILRAGALMSKSELRRAGFANSHFRSTSSRQDEARGFADFVHLSTLAHPPILKAKLAGGFPHFEISIASPIIEQHGYLLCRFNIAKTRYFRGALQEPPESRANGKYLGSMALPVASTDDEKRGLLEENNRSAMIEVLVRDRIQLPAPVELTAFSRPDALAIEEIAQSLGVAVSVFLEDSLSYTADDGKRRAVFESITRAMTELDWKGNGLDFDRM